MGSEAGICEIAIDVPPLPDTTVIEHLEFVGDDEGDYRICQTFLEHHQAPHAPVAVLKRMNLLETHMKIKDIFKRLPALMMIRIQQCYRQVFEPNLGAKIRIFADIGKF